MRQERLVFNIMNDGRIKKITEIPFIQTNSQIMEKAHNLYFTITESIQSNFVWHKNKICISLQLLLTNWSIINL